MHEPIIVNRNYLPRNFARTAIHRLKNDGYKGFSAANIYYAAKTGKGNSSGAILRVLAGMAVNHYQKLNKHKYEVTQ